MLVLTRKLGEMVNVGPDVEIFVVGVSCGKVKLGFRAPRDIVIQRAEVASRTQPREGDCNPEHAVLARIGRSEMSTTPPLRLFRQLGSA